jgi:hypothetical protein
MTILITSRTAVKKHWCNRCWKPITIGTTYNRVFYTRHEGDRAGLTAKIHERGTC